MTITHQRWRAVVAIVLALGASASGCRSDVTSFETCDVCQSTRELSSSGERLLHRGKNVDHGPHMWTTGLKLAEATPIDVGAVVLLRRVPAGATAPVFGAVVITQQEMSPQRVSYRWYWRPDGQATLDPADPAVQQGEERGQNRIKFGPFDVHWSGSGDRGGFMYYERFSHMPIGANTTFVCKTEIRSLSGLDASSSRWLFKSSVVDQLPQNASSSACKKIPSRCVQSSRGHFARDGSAVPRAAPTHPARRLQASRILKRA